MNFFIVNNDNIEKKKRSVYYNNTNSNLYYVDTTLNLHSVNNYRFITNEEVNNINIPYILYVVKSEDNTSCNLYQYNEDGTITKLTTNNAILALINSTKNSSKSAILEDKDGSFVPITNTRSVYTIDGNKTLEDVLADPLSANIGKYKVFQGYIEILNPDKKVYTLPTAPDLTISRSSFFVLMYNNEVVDSSKYTVIDNDFQIQFNDDFQLVENTKITIIMGYHTAVDIASLVIDHGNLSEGLSQYVEGHERHGKDYYNPHNTTKSQVGLGNVQNFPIATNTDVSEGTSNSSYMTPQKTRQMILDMMAAGYIEYSSYLFKEKIWKYTYNTTVSSYNIPDSYYNPSIDNILIYKCGLILEPNVDYTISGRTVRLLIEIEQGAEIVHRCISIVPNDQERAPISKLKSTYKWTSTQASRDSFGLPASIFTSSCRVELYQEGIRLVEGEDYTLSINIVELTNPVPIGDSIVAYIFETDLLWANIKDHPRAIDNLTSDSTTDYLSARQGKVLKTLIGNSLQSYRIAGNTETIVENGNVTTYTITDPNGATLAVEEVTVNEDGSVINVITTNDERARISNKTIIETRKDGNTTIKKYL